MAFGPQSSPVSTKMREVKGGRFEAVTKRSSWSRLMRVPAARHLHWIAQRPLPSLLSATRSIPVSVRLSFGCVSAQSAHSQTFENWSL